MKRWHEDIVIMERELRLARLFGYYEGLGKGVFRKRKHYSSCSPNQHCLCCEMDRSDNRIKKRKERERIKLELRYEIE